MKRASLILLILFSTTAFAAAPKPTQMIARDSCVTAECHATVKDFKVLHGPVNVNACDACHKSVDPAKHTFELARNKTETCTFCHQIDTQNAAVVHKPVADGQCLSCHNPHGGANNKFFRGKSMRELCATCHKDPVGENKHLHGPVAAGACDSCHTSHTSQFPKLLPAKGRDLCFTCHSEMKAQMASAKFTHKAVEGDCGDCHDPHASNFPMQVKQEPVALCGKCHEKVAQVATTATHKHSVVMKDAACLNCHTAHGGDLAKLMRNEPVQVCMKCHATDQKDPSGRVIKNVAMIMDPKQVKHGPIRDGNCAGCHDTHGSNQSRLLIKPYPETFYQPFAQEKYDLCFTCHDKQLVLTEKTANLTGFRNGDVNLHFLHVNRDKGRNCRSCHQTHASGNELHVRDSVPFGKWEMPIKFVKVDTGGSCSPGCHKPYTYDRVKPLDYQATPPTTAPVKVVSQ
jgi:predicted CXXCH cytochrome family protein